MAPGHSVVIATEHAPGDCCAVTEVAGASYPVRASRRTSATTQNESAPQRPQHPAPAPRPPPVDPRHVSGNPRHTARPPPKTLGSTPRGFQRVDYRALLEDQATMHNRLEVSHVQYRKRIGRLEHSGSEGIPLPLR